MSSFATFAATVAEEATVRSADFDGQPHLVAPVVAVQESILKGFLLPAEEIHAAAPAFNGKPLPVGHPTEGGQFVSANTPERMQNESVGWLFNVAVAEADDTTKLVGETWVNVEKSIRLANERDPVYGVPLHRLAQHAPAANTAAVAAFSQLPAETAELSAKGPGDTLLEVSTAYWFDPDESPGTFNGDAYVAVQRNVRPDHLALLPMERGECSTEDGCGLPRVNQADDGLDEPTETEPADSDGTALTVTGTTNVWTTDSTMNANGTLTSLRQFAHNCVHGCGGTCHRDDTMTDINDLSGATGIDAEVLEAMSEEDRENIAALAEAAEDDGGDEADASDGDDSPTDSPPAEVAEDDGTEQLTTELKELREELAEVRELAAAQANAEHEALVDRVEPHSSLDRAALEDLDTVVLEGMAADLAPARADYGGRVSGVPSANSKADDEQVAEAATLAAQLSGRDVATDGGAEEGDD